MSKPKYDVKRIPQEVFDRWHEEMVATNYLQQTNPASIDRRLVDAARVPETTAAELENRLVEMVLHADVSSEKWLRAKLRELQEAHTREAKESDSE